MAESNQRQRIVVATRNVGKQREFQQMLVPLGYEVLSLTDYPELSDIEETGKTFLANAEIKAKTAADALGVPVIADDSGLTVARLDGAPGVYSARYAGQPTDDAANIHKLLMELERVATQPEDEVTLASGETRKLLSKAAFICSIVFYDPETQDQIVTEGRVEGWILDQPTGDGGFGYDPVFYVSTHGRTMAQLSSEEKHAISHRGQALRQLMEQLKEQLS